MKKIFIAILLILWYNTIRADRVAPEKAVLPEPPCCTQIISGTISGDSIMKTIPLSRGLVAFVDDEDFDRINLHVLLVGEKTRKCF